jgi:cytochrome c1
MKNAKRSIFSFVAALSLAGALAATPAFAADKTYQVTGPILEVTDSSITVQKGKEKWQIARTKDTKVTGDLKVGAKVTITYTMTAASVEAKGDGKTDSKADKAGK